MQGCVFCGIAEGKIPSEKLYETENVLSFMDINPGTKGHCLVIPKKHAETITDVSEKDLRDVISAVQKVAKAIKKSLSPEGLNVHQSNGAIAGQVVNHAHFHIFPRFKGDGQSFKWIHTQYKEGEMQEIAGKIRKNLH